MRRVLISIAVSVSIVGIMISYLIYYFFFSLCHLPEGELVEQINSANKSYTINMYQVNGGATTSYSIRGELVDHIKGSKKNIYWGYRENQTRVKWLDDYTVTINDRKLDVRKDTYDWRRNKDINSLQR
ncbi:MAG: hypothetical protein K0Q94_1186 [Paenibacillus sp.]|jgi:hypothetical protein|uniref:DUF5412 domain-containing protein n=1 Tax=Paenibacillus sp. GCM10012303 TaxID=3317340 RepID=UPI0029E97329|nr:hypothetical protein [Paenibacillus sp.]